MKKFKDNMKLEEQTDILAKFLMDKFGGPIKSEGAIEMAIRLLEEYKELTLELESQEKNYD